MIQAECNKRSLSAQVTRREIIFILSYARVDGKTEFYLNWEIFSRIMHLFRMHLKEKLFTSFLHPLNKMYYKIVAYFSNRE